MTRPIEIPMPLYHGTSSAFNAFDPSKTGYMTGASSARQGVWLARDPELADYFARLAAERSGGNAQIDPLVQRSERPAFLTLTGNETHHEVAATLAQAWDDGYTSVRLKNYTSPSGSEPEM